MERRPPNARVQDRANHAMDGMKDAKEAYSQNHANLGKGSQHDPHEPQSDEAFLEHMNEKLKESSASHDKPFKPEFDESLENRLNKKVGKDGEFKPDFDESLENRVNKPK